MNPSFIQPPQVAGPAAHLPMARCYVNQRALRILLRFSPMSARVSNGGELVVYDVEMLDTSSAEGALYTGVTHLYPGKVGNEYFMTRGHFHARREQGEVYFGLRGSGLLLLQDEQGEAR
jgi:glucose-6-phosphate isomerase